MPSTTNVSGTPAAIALIVSLSLWLFLSNRRGRGSSPIGGRLLVDRHTGDSRENLFLTYSSADRVPPETLARFVEAARPYFEVRFYDDDEPVGGGHKGDLFRYCALYMLGGAFLDIDIVVEVPLHEIFEVPITLLQSCVAYHPGHIYQAVLAAPRGHPVLRTCANHVLAAPVPADFIAFIQFLREELERMVGETYPLRVGDDAYPDLRLLREDGCPERCSVYDASGRRLARSKDPSYPWH